MQNIIPIIKDFLYSAFLAILPTLLSFIVWDFVPEPSIGYDWVVLISFLTFTFIVFILRQLLSEKRWQKTCFFLFFSMMALLILVTINGWVICNHIGGEYKEAYGATDINGVKHSYYSGGDNFGDNVCFITPDELKKINPEAPFYKMVAFVIEN